jgi:hypothetical protein
VESNLQLSSEAETAILRTVRTTIPPIPDGWERDIDFAVNIPNTDNDENPYAFSIAFTAIK